MIFNMVGGGGGSGATLVVSSPANVSVTVSKDDKSYTKNSGSLGSATFKGLSTGTWTVTISGNGQTATKTIEITADYSITIAFFSATINVTYPSGSACKATHTDGTVLNAPDTSGTWTCVVPKSGTWTILAEDTSAGKSKSVDVSITTEGQVESVTLNYELVLFDNGTYAAETGGWNGISGNNLVASVSGVPAGEDGYGYFSSGNSVDLSGYNTIYFTIAYLSGTSEQHNGTLSAGGASLSLQEGAGGTVSFDISAVSSGRITGTAHAWGAGARCTLAVSKVWVN